MEQNCEPVIPSFLKAFNVAGRPIDLDNLIVFYLGQKDVDPLFILRLSQRSKPQENRFAAVPIAFHATQWNDVTIPADIISSSKLQCHKKKTTAADTLISLVLQTQFAKKWKAMGQWPTQNQEPYSSMPYSHCPNKPSLGKTELGKTGNHHHI